MEANGLEQNIERDIEHEMDLNVALEKTQHKMITEVIRAVQFITHHNNQLTFVGLSFRLSCIDSLCRQIVAKMQAPSGVISNEVATLVEEKKKEFDAFRKINLEGGGKIDNDCEPFSMIHMRNIQVMLGEHLGLTVVEMSKSIEDLCTERGALPSKDFWDKHSQMHKKRKFETPPDLNSGFLLCISLIYFMDMPQTLVRPAHKALAYVRELCLGVAAPPTLNSPLWLEETFSYLFRFPEELHTVFEVLKDKFRGIPFKATYEDMTTNVSYVRVKRSKDVILLLDFSVSLICIVESLVMTPHGLFVKCADSVEITEPSQVQTPTFLLLLDRLRGVCHSHGSIKLLSNMSLPLPVFDALPVDRLNADIKCLKQLHNMLGVPTPPTCFCRLDLLNSLYERYTVLPCCDTCKAAVVAGSKVCCQYMCTTCKHDKLMTSLNDQVTSSVTNSVTLVKIACPTCLVTYDIKADFTLVPVTI
jgi:hypothetical protein